jgi:tRNA(Ile)-lysidine synthase
VLKSFLHFIEQAGLPLKQGQTVLLAVSGGADSVCLARLMHLAGFSAAIAHVNYGLRGKESDEDARFTAGLAKELGYPFHLLEAAVLEKERKSGGLQAAARKLRYDWFGSLCRQFGYAQLATAHQADDVYETFLLYEKKGRMHAAMNALPLIRALDLHDPESPLLLRPLRFARRGEIRTWLQEQGYTWREDSSNAKPTYERNRLRLDLDLAEAGKHASVAEIDEKQRLFAQQSLAWQALTQTLTSEEYGEKVIHLDALYQRPEGKVWLQWYLRPFGFNRAQCEQVWKDGRNAGKTQVARAGWRIETARGYWYLLREAWQPRKPALVQPGETISSLPFFTFTLESAGAHAYPYGLSRMAFQFDEENPVLELRPMQAGETMHIANAGHRKISDILSEAGIPKHRRAVWPLVCYRQEVIAIPFVKRSGLYPVLSKEARVFWLKADHV